MIEQEMARTRASLTEKLEALESQVADTVQTATEAVQTTTETVSETVENVKETVEAVTGTVENTVRSIGDSLNLSRQAELRPWLVFGSSVAAGCLLGWLTTSRPRRSRTSTTQMPPIPSSSGEPMRATTYRSQPAEPAPSEKTESKSWFGEQSWVGEQLGRLKGLAVGTLLGALRDVATRAVPESVSGRLAEELDRVTTQLGGEPIHGKVIPSSEPAASTAEPKGEQRSGPKSTEQPAKEAGRKGRVPVGNSHN